MRIRFAGFGGQGIVLSGLIIGAAAGLEGKNVVQNQSYGSSARGGSCTSEVSISATEIYELEPEEFDILCAMSQESYDSFSNQLVEGGHLFIDPSLVKIKEGDQERYKIYSLPVTDMAQKRFNNKMVANVIMLGLINSVLKVVKKEHIQEKIGQYVPAKTIDLNLEALDCGYN